jgi:hypothetical protein
MFKFLGFHNRPEASPDVTEIVNLAEDIKKYNIRFELTVGKPGQPLEFVLVSQKPEGLTVDQFGNSPINTTLKNIEKKLNTVPGITFDEIMYQYGNEINAGPGLKFRVAQEHKDSALKALADLGVLEYASKKLKNISALWEGYQPPSV